FIKIEWNVSDRMLMALGCAYRILFWRFKMSQNKWDKHRQRLLTLKEQILKSGFTTRGEDLQIPQEELSDEADLANSVIAQQVSFQIRDREMSKLRFINMALERIENGSYGH